MAGYYFNLPQITQLTIPQQAALNETKQIALSGGPGTGKSVVSLWRHISNYKNGKKSLLLTYATTLARYLQACCATQEKNASKNVGRAYKNKPSFGSHWNEIIIDEAQDLETGYFDDIRNNGKVTYGADDSQIVYPDKSTKQAELKKIYTDNIEYVLDKNYRSTLRIMEFAHCAFPDAIIYKDTLDELAKRNVGVQPVLLISKKNKRIDGQGYELSNNLQDNAIISIVKQFGTAATNNIAILAPWKKDVKYFDELLKNNGVSDYSVYYEDKIDFPNGADEIKNIHITTFKSAKGLEFDVVIIPNFYNISRIEANIIIKGITEKNKEELKNVLETFDIHKHISEKKPTIDLQTKESKIDEIRKKVETINGIKMRTDMTWKDLYVGVTRARSNLYLITSQAMPQYNSLVQQSKLD